jgi:hypothetical protein
VAELTQRYVVMPTATDAPFDLADPDGGFVLKPWKDPAALRALKTYRDNCYPELGRELDLWIQAIEAGPVVRGDVGRRNEPHVKRDATRRRAVGRTTRPATRGAARKDVRRPAGRRPAPKRRKRRR